MMASHGKQQRLGVHRKTSRRFVSPALMARPASSTTMHQHAALHEFPSKSKLMGALDVTEMMHSYKSPTPFRTSLQGQQSDHRSQKSVSRDTRKEIKVDSHHEVILLSDDDTACEEDELDIMHITSSSNIEPACNALGSIGHPDVMCGDGSDDEDTRKGINVDPHHEIIVLSDNDSACEEDEVDIIHITSSSGNIYIESAYSASRYIDHPKLVCGDGPDDEDEELSHYRDGVHSPRTLRNMAQFWRRNREVMDLGSTPPW